MASKFNAGLEQTAEAKNIWQMPKMYRVIIHNDDITTTDFVVDVLMLIFHKDKNEAVNIMLEVHNGEKGVAGVYTYDIAATKKMQTDQMANEKGFPLRLTLEEEI